MGLSNWPHFFFIIIVARSSFLLEKGGEKEKKLQEFQVRKVFEPLTNDKICMF